MDWRQSHTRFIKQTATRLGFDYCGIAKAERLDDDAARLEQWLNKDMHGTMKYMENHFELRVNPGLLVPGAQVGDHIIKKLLSKYTAGR